MLITLQNDMLELLSLDPVEASLHRLSESPVVLQRLIGAVLSQAGSVGHRPLPCRAAHQASGS